MLRYLALVIVAATAMNTSVCAQFLTSQPRAIIELATNQVSSAYPFLTDNGLTVYWVKGTVLYSATRPALSSNFAPGVQVSGLTGQTSITGCWLSNDQLSIFFTRGSVLYYATRASLADAFGTPQTVSLPNTISGTICSPSLSPDLSELLLCVGTSTSVTAVYSLQREGTTLAYSNPVAISQFIITGYITSTGQLSKNGLSFYNSVGSYSGSKQLARYDRATVTSAWDNGHAIPWEATSSTAHVMSPSVSANEHELLFTDNSTYPFLYTAIIKSTQVPKLIPMPDGVTDIRPTFRWRKVSGVSQYTITIYHPTGAMSMYASDTFFTPTSDLSFGQIRWQLTSDNSGIAYDTFTLVDARIPRIIPYQPELSGTPRPTFSWHPVTGAASYYLTGKVGNAWVISQNVADTFYTPQNDLPLNQITWSVTSNLIGTSSVTDTFIVTQGTIPELIRFNGLQDTTHRPTFRWHPVSGYSSYILRMSANSDIMVNPFLSTSTTDTFYTPSINMPLPSGPMHWSVSYSPVGIFAATDSLFTVPALAPILVAPYHDQYNFPLADTLIWNSLTGIQGYKLEIATDAAFTNKFQATSSDTTFLYSGLQYATRYYWRIAGYANAVNGIWGVDSFITEYPPAPKMLSPRDSSTGQPTTITFRWNRVSPGVAYHLTVGNDQYGNSNFIDTAGLSDTTFTITGLKGAQTYYWSVVSVYNTKGYLGTKGYFTTSLIAPKLLVPGNNVIGFNWYLPFTFKWSGKYGARYKLQVDSSMSFSTPLYAASALYDSSLTIGSYNVPTLTLKQYTRYYWRVQTVLSYLPDSLSPWGIDSFYTSGENGNIKNIAPVNCASILTDTITFRWRSLVPYFGAYQVVIASDTGLYNLVKTDTVVGDTSLVVVGLVKGKRYFWSVRALQMFNTGYYQQVFQLNTTGLSTAILPKEFGCSLRNGISSNGNSIRYTLPKAALVSVRLLNLQGRLVQTIVCASQNAGYYDAVFDVKNFGTGYLLLDFKAGSFKKLVKVLVK